MRTDPKSIGERSEAQVVSALLKHGKTILTPFGDNQRYDMVIDEGGRFYRVQCKTGRLRDGAVEFSTCSSQAHRGKGRQSYRGQIEFFAVYCPDNDRTYLVPVDSVPVTLGILRVEAPRNGQLKGVRQAAPYELTQALLSGLVPE